MTLVKQLNYFDKLCLLRERAKARGIPGLFSAGEYAGKAF